MSSFPCLVRFVSGSGLVRYRLGDRLVDRYLEFVAGLVRQRDHARDRAQTDRAALFDSLIQRAEAGPATTERS